MQKRLTTYLATFLAASVALFSSTTLRADDASAEKSQLNVKNASFETASAKNGAKDWSASPDFFRLDKGGRTGEFALRWDSTDENEYRLANQQLGAVEPGTNFKFSVWVKTENVVGGGATACVEWYGADGKWLGGSYANNVKGTISDWTRVVGSGVIPEGAVRASASCYVQKHGTGTAWFDDFEIEEITPPFLSGIASNRYRQIVDGGDLTIRVGVRAQELNGDISGLNAPLKLVGDATESEFAPSAFGADYVEFVVPTDKLAPGKYVASYSAKNPNDGQIETVTLAVKRVKELPEVKTRIDEYRRAVVDGKPFFPLGLYFGGVKADELEIFADSAFNCLMPYHAISRETLDLCAANDIRVIYSVKDNFPSLAVDTIEEGIAKTKATVAAMKDHPAIFAWYINDELPLAVVDQLTERRDLMEELDPSRPTWAVLYQIDEIRGYISTCDVLGTDPYPIPTKSPSIVADYSFRTNAAAFQTQAVWQVPQIFNWAAYKKGDEKKEYRAPTYVEMRSAAWSSIVGGANGLIFYSWFDLWKMDKTVENGGSALVREPFEERWPEVKKMAAEVAEYFPILLAVETPLDVQKSENANVATRLYGCDGKTWALTVNASEEPQKVTLNAAGARFVELKLGGKIVSKNGGTVEIELAPLEPCFAVFAK